ncbi:MAG: RNA polymerase sigma factor [Lachnospiraceae bacterium]|nr:RNA polymerase sigma factor [Lachnospiraceae bacterium]
MRQVTEIGKMRKRHAVEPLYLSYYNDLYRYALSLLNSVEDAEDAVQNTFLYAMKDWRSLFGMKESERKNCLFAALRNASLDILRRRKREVSLEELELQEKVTCHMTRERQEVLEALNGLARWHRNTLIEAYVFERTSGEIAERLGMKKNAIEKRIDRAKAAIRGWYRTGIYW